MVSTTEQYGWAIALLSLIVFAIPWFLWGVDRVVFGLPVWLWWHIGWLLLATITFWIFTRRAWGIGIVTDADRSRESEP